MIDRVRALGMRAKKAVDLFLVLLKYSPPGTRELRWLISKSESVANGGDTLRFRCDGCWREAMREQANSWKRWGGKTSRGTEEIAKEKQKT
jgi:hypothetical protein